MAITKRGDKGSALTYQEMDDNFDAITPRTSETGAVQIPAGTTGERPTGSEGHLRFNTASKQFEGFQGTVWTSVGAGGGGAGAPGPQGVQGPAGGGSGDGIQGERGIQGTDGIAIQGADGGPGIQGPAGSVQGLQGTDGNDGLGIQGSAGTPGATGPQGTAGEDGDPGVQGPAGSIQGLQGFQGFQGAGGGLGGQGVQGQAGSSQGIQGIEGNPGDEGTQGFQGFQGPAGLAQGVQGIQGGDGPAGFGFQGIQGGGGQGVQGLQGNDGPAGFGLQGMQGLQGDEGPGGTGPQGVQGVQGNPSNIPGPQGVEGPEGPQGTQGAQASQGVQGTQGADGVGDEGPQGIQGVMVQGITGADGVQGLLGLQGIQGTVGVQGESVTGDTGIQGVQGLQGSVGENGFQGVQGPGIQGEIGVQGLAGNGNQGVQGFDAQGVQGSQGTQGLILQGLQGTGGTPGFQGVQGNQGVAVQGVQGPFGIQGPADGVQGPEGPPGIQGPSDGAQGIQGTAGDNGVGVQGSSGGQGIQGLQGPSDGPQGPQGIQGIGLQGTTGAGTQGVQGVTGLQGPSDGADGNQGIQGTSGFQGASGSYGGTEFPYSWNTSTLGGDPGAGRFAADAANLQFATVLYIDDADSATVDIQSYLRTTDDPAGNVKGHIRVSPAGTPNQYVLYSISTVTEETGFFEIGVVWEAGNRTSFTNQTDLIISFERAGAIGTQGAQGTTGAGVQGLIGLQGIQGMQGVQGLQGVSEAGTQGLQGLQGPEAQDPDVSADTSPQLGGNLDLNGKEFTGSIVLNNGTSDTSITLDGPNGANNLVIATGADDAEMFVYNALNVKNAAGTDTYININTFSQLAWFGNTSTDSRLAGRDVAVFSTANTDIGNSLATDNVNIGSISGPDTPINMFGPVKFTNLTTTQRDALTVTGGEVIFNETTSKLQVYNGSNWKQVAVPSIDDNGTATAMTIDASGNLLVGKTATDSGTVGFEAAQDGHVYVTVNDTLPAYINRQSGDEMLRFASNGATVGSIGTLSSRLHIENGDTGLRIAGDIDQIFPCGSGGGDRDAAIDLGSTGVRFKDLYLSGGVHLGGTGAANKLDDYEEGTWTPAITYQSGGPNSPTQTSGSYTKIGRLVNVNGTIICGNTNSGSGLAFLAGLPFTVSDTVGGTSVEANGTVGYFANLGTTVNTITLSAIHNTLYCELYTGVLASNATTATVSTFNSGAQIRFSLTYYTND